MATKNNQRIRDMVELLALTGKEMLPLAREGKNYKVTTKTLSEYIGSTGGGSLPTDAAAQIKQNTENIEIIQNNITSLSNQLDNNKEEIDDLGQLVNFQKTDIQNNSNRLDSIEDDILDISGDIEGLKSLATTTSSGLMSAQDKMDLNTLMTFYEGTDTDSTINSWKELEKFLEDFDTTKDLADLLSVKADKETVVAINSRVTDLETSDFVDIDSLRSTLEGYYTKEQVDDLLGEAGGVDLTGYVNEIAASGTGNGIASVSKDGSKLTFNKATFLTDATVPAARTTLYGGIKIGYKDNGKNYGVLLDDSGKAYVNVPWESYDLSKFLETTGGAVNYLQVSPAKASDSETINIGVTANEISGTHGNGTVDWKINSNGAWIGANQLATQSWVDGKGYLTASSSLASANLDKNTITIASTSVSLGGSITQNQLIANLGLKGLAFKDSIEITSSNVTTALGYTPYNSANFTKANIKSTLGISDWALASSKPTYTASEVGALSSSTTIPSKGTVTGWGFVTADDVAAELENFLPLDGGKMSGPIEYDDYTSLGAHSDGNFYLGNPTRSLIIRSNGTHTINANTLIHSGNISDYTLANINGVVTHNGTLEVLSADNSVTIKNGSIISNTGGTDFWSIDDSGNGVFNSLKVGSSDVIHSGNIGSQSVNYATSAGNADTLDGYHADSFVKYMGAALLPTQINCLGYGYGHDGWLIYGPAFTFGVNTYYARIQKNYNTNALYLGGYSSELGELGWREFAFTDSTVAAANKLVTSGGVDVLTTNSDSYLYDKNGANVYQFGATGVSAYPSYQLFGTANGDYVGVYQGGVAVALKTGNIERLWVNSSGNVTIGGSDLAGTSAKLHVDGNLRIGTESASYTTQNYIYLWKGDGTQRHRGLQYVNEKGYSFNYYNPDSGVYKELRIGPNGLSFANENSSQYSLIINSSGNVGIGTTDPAYRLRVAGNGAFNNEICVYDADDIYRLTCYEYQGIGRIYSYNETDDVFGDLWIGNNNGGIITVKASGNVGIGTTNPNTKLHVVGGAKVEGALSTYGITATTTAATDAAFTHYVGSAKLWWVSSYNNCANFHTALYVQSGSSPIKVATVNDLSSYLPKAGGSLSGALTLVGTESTTASLNFTRAAANYIIIPTGSNLHIGTANASASAIFSIQSGVGVKVNGNGAISGDLTVGGTVTIGGSRLFTEADFTSINASLNNKANTADVIPWSATHNYASTVNPNVPTSPVSDRWYLVVKAAGNGNQLMVNIPWVNTTYDLSSYLPKAGGKISGSLTFSATSGSHIIGNSTQGISFKTTSNSDTTLYFEQQSANSYSIRSDDEAAYWNLGDDLNRFNVLYCRSVSQSSDATKKNILGNVQLTPSQIANAPAVHFTWKNGGVKDVGTIAQYWKNVLPEVVSGEEGSYGMNYAVLGVVSSIILARNIETHEQRIARLEKEISDLQKELNALVNNE